MTSISGDKTTSLTKFRVVTLLCWDPHLMAILDEKESRNGNIWVISSVDVNFLGEKERERQYYGNIKG